MDRTDGSHWFYSYLPQGVAGGATSTLIPLFAYALGGSLLTVGIIAAATSLASVPAFILWGSLSDRTARRKIFLLIGFLGSGLALFAMALCGTMSQFYLANLLAGFLGAASGPAGTVLLIGALIGAVVGTVFTLKVLNQETFEAFFVAVLIVFGLYMVRDWVKNARSVDEDDDSALTPRRVGGTAAATAGSGFLSGSMGIGGGLLNVPLLVYVLGRKTRKAIGTSSLLIIPTAAVGFAAYVVDLALRPGGFAWPAEFVLIPIMMPIVFVGAYLGSRWGLEKLRTRSVALLFIIVLFIAAAKLVFDLL